MPQFDLPLSELETYKSSSNPPADLYAFWHETLSTSRQQATASSIERVDTGMRLVDTFDLTFSGYNGQQVRAWVHVPHDVSKPLPTIVEYQGYTHGRRLAWQNHYFAEAGYVHVAMDTRGQGWASVGATPDADNHAGESTVPGLMTRGITDRDTYYFRRVFADAALLVDAVAALDFVDESRIAVAGGSQGGGIAIAATALNPTIVGASVDVPFLCDFPRAVTVTDAFPYSELITYMARYRDRVDETFDVLRYFDGAHLATMANVPALFSVALRDEVCPPSTVFAAFNAWNTTEKRMSVYPFNRHEGGDEHHMVERLRFFRELFSAEG